ncbi:MAG: division/cell wall cluster transcriptional repressor MraZ [Lachnospiraceae bacterium]|nr:division/cell wall cluster transcriptional repressor MraZ [Lachnospiraceae bacterium]
MSALFAGKYNHTLDSKSRVIVPAKFKKNLGDTFELSLGLDGCLYIFPNERWEMFVEELDSLPATSKNVRALKRAFLANATECEIDKQGRIVIPADLRAKAGLNKELVFVGVGHKIELWAKERFDEADENLSIEEMAEDLTEYGISF